MYYKDIPPGFYDTDDARELTCLRERDKRLTELVDRLAYFIDCVDYADHTLRIQADKLCAEVDLYI